MKKIEQITDWQEMIGEVMHADCLEVMRKMPDNCVDLVLTDPPYNIGQSNKGTKVGNKIMTNKEAWGKWDEYEPDEFNKFMFKLINEVFRVLKDGGSFYCFTAREKNGFYCEYAQDIGFNYINTIAIIKNNPLPHFSKNGWRSGFELAFFCTKGKAKCFNFGEQKDMINYFNYTIGQKETKHPTEKPVKILEKIIQVSSNEHDLVFDPFGGSFSTARASQNLNRKFISCDMEKEYCEIGEKRLLQQNLF